MPRAHQATVEDQGRLERTLADALANEPDVDFAFLHGSFLSELPFHDIDLAVMFSGRSAQEDMRAAIALGDRLERIVVAYPVDVRALNHAPVTFQFKALRGRVLLCRDERRLATFIEDALPRYFDLAPRLALATKEAFTS